MSRSCYFLSPPPPPPPSRVDNRHTAKTGGDFFRRSRAAERRKNRVLSFTAWDVNKNHHTVDGRNPAPADNGKYPIIYKVLYNPGGAGFLPSRVWHGGTSIFPENG